MNSLLKQERLNHNWSRAYVEAKTGIPQRSLENWEEGIVLHPHQESIDLLCHLYGKTAVQLGLTRKDNYDIVVVGNNVQNSQGETTMSDLIRRSTLLDLGSYLFGLVSTWPRRNHQYGELQESINKAVVDHGSLVGQDAISALNRRQALMSLGLVPIRLTGGFPVTDPKKTDTNTLLTHCAAGIAAAWYLRRGKDLAFVSDLISSYIAILQPLLSSKSEAHRQASATLLSQSFRLKGSIAGALQNGDQAIPYYHEAIRYGLMAGNSVEQAIANRMMAFSFKGSSIKTQGVQEQALFYAEKAHGLVNDSTPRMVRSFTASGLSLCQAMNGHTDDAKISLSEARNYFDGTEVASSLNYTESNLLAIRANVHQYCGLWQESMDLWGESLATPDISAIGSIQARIQYTEAEVSRDDQDRNMDLCVKLLTEAIDGAKELDSQYYIYEASECCNLLRAAWPREAAIKELRQHL